MKYSSLLYSALDHFYHLIIPLIYSTKLVPPLSLTLSFPSHGAACNRVLSTLSTITSFKYRITPCGLWIHLRWSSFHLNGLSLKLYLAWLSTHTLPGLPLHSTWLALTLYLACPYTLPGLPLILYLPFLPPLHFTWLAPDTFKPSYTYITLILYP
jgi:hypothetical protein